MAAPSYTTDLATFNLADSTTGWSESSNTAWDDGGTPSADTDYPTIQGTTAISQTMTKTTICSLIADYGSTPSLPTDGAYLIWQQWFNAAGLDSLVNGGMRVIVGSGLGDFYWWASGGDDAGRSPYGGWANNAVNPTVTTGRTSVGTPGTVGRYVGSAIHPQAAPSKGQPHSVDAIRWGRCESRFNDGDLGSGYATFSGFATVNDYNDVTNGYNQWGLLQSTDYGYLFKGLMRLGYASGGVVDFRDSDAFIIVDDQPNVTASFNAIHVEQATSRVDWTNVTILSLNTVSPCDFSMEANADVNFDMCRFVDMGTFTILSAATILDTSFEGCDVITITGANMSGSSFSGYEGTADTSAVAWTTGDDTDGALDGASFTMGTALTHAIEFEVAGVYTFNDIDFSGYSALNQQSGSVIFNNLSAVLMDSYSDTNQDDEGQIGDATTYARAQSFTATAGDLSAARFDLRKFGSPTGNLVCHLYASDGGSPAVPTGAILATSEPLDVSTLTGTLALTQLNFGDAYTLTGSTSYFLVLDYGDGDSSNHVRVGMDSSSPSHGGNAAYYTTGWTGESGVDIPFYAYRDGQVVINISGGSGTVSSKTVNLGCHVTTYNTVPLAITVVDDSGSPIQDAQTAIHIDDATRQILLNADTDAQGEASAQYDYPGTEQDIVLKVRKSDRDNEVVDSWTADLYGTGFWVFNDTFWSAGQTFTMGGTAKVLTGATFWIEGTPVGFEDYRCTARLYAVTGSPTRPTGTPLAVSEPVDFSHLVVSSYERTDFWFKDEFTMQASTEYAIVVYADDLPASLPDLDVRNDNTTVTHAGHGVRNGSGTWLQDTSREICFAVYTTPDLRYFPFSTTGVVTASGFSQTVTLKENTYL